MITLSYAPLSAYLFFPFTLCPFPSVSRIVWDSFSRFFPPTFLVHIICSWCSPILLKMRRVVLYAHLPSVPVLVWYDNCFSVELLTRPALLYHHLDPSIRSISCRIPLCPWRPFPNLPPHFLVSFLPSFFLPSRSLYRCWHVRHWKRGGKGKETYPWILCIFSGARYRQLQISEGGKRVGWEYHTVLYTVIIIIFFQKKYKKRYDTSPAS